MDMTLRVILSLVEKTNILCFDTNSNNFSQRLIACMNAVAKKTHKENIEILIMEDDIDFLIEKEYCPYLSQFKVEIYPGLTKKYEEFGLTNHKDKKSIVIGLTKTNVIAGGY